MLTSRGSSVRIALYLKMLAVGLAYLLAARYGIAFSYRFVPSFQVWPATGLALAAVLLWGYWMLVPLAAAAFAVGLLMASPPLVIAALTVGTPLSAGLGAYLLREWAEFDVALNRVRDVMALVVLGSIVSTAAIATLMVWAQGASGLFPSADWGIIWLERWLAHSISVLIATPLLLVWLSRPLGFSRPLQIAEGAVMLSLVVLSSALAFTDWFALHDLYVHLMFLPFLLLLVATLRLGIRGVVTSATVIVGMALVTTFAGLGPFADLALEDPLATHSEQLALMWFFVATVMTSGMFGGAALHERRQAQVQVLAANLRSSESVSNLRAVFRNMNEGMALLSPDGKVLSINAAALRINGFEDLNQAKEALGTELLEGRFDDARRRLGERYEILSIAGEPIPMERWPALVALRGEEMRDYEVRVRDRKQDREWIERFNGTRVQDDRGRFSLYVLAMEDITDRVEMNRAIRASETRYRRLAETSTVGLAIGRVGGEVQFVNSALAELLGHGVGELKLSHLLLRESRLEFQVGPSGATLHTVPTAIDADLLRELREKGSCEPFESKISTRGGGEIHALVGASVLHTDEEGDLLAVFVIDVSRQKQAESELRRLNETLEHRVRERTEESEQRALLLKAFAMALTQSEQEERRRMAARLHDNLQQLIAGALIRLDQVTRRIDGKDGQRLEQVAALLRESIEEARNLTTELSPAILNHGDLSDCLRWLAGWIQEKYQLKVEFEYEDGDFEVDTELKHTLFDCTRELLLNVHQHAGANNAKLRLERDDRKQVVITVSDDGRGCTEEVLRQAPRSKNFGLFQIVERIEAFGGAVEMVSRPGGGCRIQLAVPTVAERQIRGEEGLRTTTVESETAGEPARVREVWGSNQS